jgi:hypothetical protein
MAIFKTTFFPQISFLLIMACEGTVILFLTGIVLCFLCYCSLLDAVTYFLFYDPCFATTVEFLQCPSLAYVNFNIWSSFESSGISHLNSPHWIYKYIENIGARRFRICKRRKKHG